MGRLNIQVTVTLKVTVTLRLDSLFAESKELEKEIKKQLGGLKYE